MKSFLGLIGTSSSGSRYSSYVNFSYTAGGSGLFCLFLVSVRVLTGSWFVGFLCMDFGGILFLFRFSGYYSSTFVEVDDFSDGFSIFTSGAFTIFSLLIPFALIFFFSNWSPCLASHSRLSVIFCSISYYLLRTGPLGGTFLPGICLPDDGRWVPVLSSSALRG